MARVVNDKDSHRRRLVSLRKRLVKLSEFFDKLLSNFDEVAPKDVREASHSYVRMLNKIHHEFDIADDLQKQMQGDIYALLLSSVNRNDHRNVVHECNVVSKRSKDALMLRVKVIESELAAEDSESPSSSSDIEADGPTRGKG